MQGQQKTEEAVRAVLEYFHLFRHPLYIEEIQRFIGMHINLAELYDALNGMVDSGDIYMHDSFYMIEDDNQLVSKRLEGKERADKLMERAKRSAKIVSRFPFVQSVGISGSLSKGYANENSDVDLFIITQKNRLWICRTLLHIYKKFTFLWGAQHSYCMNYFIDESRLCIEEQNKFTATELATMIPVYNKYVYNQLIDSNKCWLVDIFPNINWNKEACFGHEPKKGIRVMLEPVINLLFPKQLNLLCMRITDKWWRIKWTARKYPMQDYDLAMKTRWYVSKNHPLNYQKKVLRELKENVKIPLIPAVG